MTAEGQFEFHLRNVGEFLSAFIAPRPRSDLVLRIERSAPVEKDDAGPIIIGHMPLVVACHRTGR